MTPFPVTAAAVRTALRNSIGEVPETDASVLALALVDAAGTLTRAQVLALASQPATLAQLLAIAGAGGRIASGINIVSASTPVAAGTVTANANSQDETLYLTPAGTLATLTIKVPADGSSRLGQIERIWCHGHAVTALTMSGTGSPTFLGTALTALATDTPYAFQKVAANTWARLA